MPKPTLTVQGEGRVEGPPELATVTGTVRANGRTSALVTAELAKTLKLMDAARPDIVYEGVFTEQIRVSPVVDHRRGDVVTGYSGTASTRLLIADFKDVSDVVVALSQVPDVTVGGPEWSLRHDSPLYQEARVAAVLDAYARARDYANAVGASLGGLLELSDAAPGGIGFRRSSTMMRGSGAPEQSFDFTPQPEIVTAEVTAVFRLVDPQGPPADS